MGYLDLYYKYWQPFQKFVPKKVQSLLARASQKMSDFKPSLEVYADIIQRAAHNKEHFWTGATVFWESISVSLCHHPPTGTLAPTITTQKRNV